MKVDPYLVAQNYLDTWNPAGRLVPNTEVHLDEALCREIADWYDRAPMCTGDVSEERQYQCFKKETLHQFITLLEAGIRIEPWSGGGQPYPDSRTLQQRVRETGRLNVYMTRDGHGCGGVGSRTANHPMIEPSPITIGGTVFLYNDLFRAVHDYFGHIVRGNRFSIRGEFMASRDHLQMYTPDCHNVLLAETIGQISWFYHGPHLRAADGRIPQRGEPGYLPPSKRPYSPQKTAPLPEEFVSAFNAQFMSTLFSRI